MKWFKCLIAGENFPGELVEDDKPIGFYTTRWVQAKSAEEAETIGLEMLRNDDSLQLPEGISPPANAKIFFEGIEEVRDTDVPPTQGGFTYFPMDS